MEFRLNSIAVITFGIQHICQIIGKEFENYV